MFLECKEYAKHVYIYPTIGSEGVADCVITSVPEIVGGVPAQVKEFPHMVIHNTSTQFHY